METGQTINGIAFSRGGKTLASAGDRKVQLFDVNQEKLTLKKHGPPLDGNQGVVSSVAFNKDGTTLAAGYNDGTVLLWPLHAHTGSRGRSPLKHTVGSISAAFSGDGKILAVGSWTDGTLQLWDVQKTHQGSARS